MISRTAQSGMTLIEVLITVLILAVGLLGLSGLQATSIKGSMDVAQRSQALWLANSLADRMRANPEGMTSYTSLNTAACAAPAVNCSDHGANIAGAACTTTQLATFDIWEVACGQPPVAGVIANSVDSLDITAINITCKDGNCNSNTEDIYTVAVVYTSKLVTSSQLLNDRDAQQSQTISIRVVPTYVPTAL